MCKKWRANRGKTSMHITNGWDTDLIFSKDKCYEHMDERNLIYFIYYF